MVSLVSADEWDNVKKFNKSVGEYGKYEITNWLGLGRRIIDIELKNNSDLCLKECEAIKEVKLYGDGDRIVDDVRFFKNTSEGWKPTAISEYKLYYLDKGKWKEFQLKQKFNEGTYTIKLIGKKNPMWTIEWQIKTNGFWTEEWAVWSPTLNNKLKAYYSFDESTGSVLPDVTNNGHNGTLISMENADWVAGKIGNALNFDGVNEWVNVTNGLSGAAQYSEYSWSVWVFANTEGNADFIFNHADLGGSARSIVLNPNPTQNSTVFRNSGTDASGLYVTGNWQHYVATAKEGDKTELYIDGISVANSSFAGIFGESISEYFAFAANPNDGLGNFDGKIDEMGYWSRVLTPDEVLTLYNGGSGIAFAGILVNLNSPDDNTVTSSKNISFNITAFLSETSIGNMSIYHNGTGTWAFNSTNTTSIGVDNTTVISSLFGDGFYIWGGEVCDETGECFKSENRTINIDFTSPDIEIGAPVGTLNFSGVGALETLNTTITDSSLDTCFFDYNGTNITIEGCLSGIENSTTFTMEGNNLNMIIYANDTVGSLNSTFISWNYKVFKNSETFSNLTIMGSSEEFLINISILEGLTITTASLSYNGSQTIGNIDTTTDPNNVIISEEIIIPQVAANVNLSFHWTFLLSDGSLINSTDNNQTVNVINIDDCTSFTNVILNFTLVDEELQTILENTTLEIATNIFSQDRTTLILNISDTYSTNPTAICLSTSLAGSTNYSLDLTARYEANGYAIEYFNIVNSLLLSSSETQNITLFDLNSTDSTDFQLTFKGLDFLPEEDVLIFVDRQYISENVFKTVELPKTDSNGQTILHLVRNDVVYNLRAIKDGVVLGNLQNIIAFCDDFTIGSCTISFNAIDNESVVFNYDSEVGIIYENAPTYSSTTNRVSFDFISSDGVAKNVLMNVERRDVFGNLTVCQNTLISTSGTVSCDIGLDLTDTSLFTIISVNNTEWITSNVIIDTSTFGNIGYVAWLILAIGLLLMFTESKNGILISIIFSYVGAVGLGWSVGGVTGIGSAGIWILVMTIIGIWKLNKNRPS